MTLNPVPPMKISSFLIPLALAASLGPSLHASPVISINLIPDGTEGAYDLSASDTAGYVPASNWNNVTAAGQNYTTVSAANLIDHSGGTTGTDFDYFVTGSGQGRGGSFVTAGTAPETTADDKMMKASVGTWDSGGITNYQISNLPAAFTGPGYKIYAYWGGKSAEFGPGDTIRDLFTLNAPGQDADGESFVMGYTGSGEDSHWDGTYSLSTITSTGDFTANDFGEYNYIHFTGLNSDSFTISVSQDEDRRHGQLSGIQIVAIPEPSTLILLGIALGGLLITRRNR